MILLKEDTLNVFLFIDNVFKGLAPKMKEVSIYLSIAISVCVIVYGGIIFMISKKDKVDIIVKYIGFPIMIMTIISLNLQPFHLITKFNFALSKLMFGIHEVGALDNFEKNMSNYEGGMFEFGKHFVLGILELISKLGRACTLSMCFIMCYITFYCGFLALPISIIPAFRKVFKQWIIKLTVISAWFIAIGLVDSLTSQIVKVENYLDKPGGYQLAVTTKITEKHQYNHITKIESFIKYKYEVINNKVYKTEKEVEKAKFDFLEKNPDINKKLNEDKSFFSQNETKYIHYKAITIREALISEGNAAKSFEYVGIYIIKIICFVLYFLVPKIVNIFLPATSLDNALTLANVAATGMVKNAISGGKTITGAQKNIKSGMHAYNNLKKKFGI